MQAAQARRARRGGGRRAPGRAFASALALLLLASGASAQGDATALSPREHAAWAAIGRVNAGGLNARSICTGTLVAPDLVLTAAHCVPPSALREVAPEKVHFLAGWFRDAYAAHATAREIHVHPEHAFDRRGRDRLRTDVALLVLDRPIESVAPLPLGPLPAFADDVEIIAYSNRRKEALSRAGPCVAVQVSPDMLGTTCTAVSGNSGAPLLRPDGDGRQMVAVVVATVPGESGFRSFAVRPPAILFELAGRAPP